LPPYIEYGRDNMKWTKVRTVTKTDKFSSRLCLGNENGCPIHGQKKPHFAHDDSSFTATHFKYIDGRDKPMLKGYCGGLPLKRGKSGETVEIEGRYKIESEWISMEHFNEKRLEREKELSKRRTEQAARWTECRKELEEKAPKRTLIDFDKAVALKSFGWAQRIANKYGISV